MEPLFLDPAEPDLLDAEAWDCPDRLSLDDCELQTGRDWRRLGGVLSELDGEGER